MDINELAVQIRNISINLERDEAIKEITYRLENLCEDKKNDPKLPAVVNSTAKPETS